MLTVFLGYGALAVGCAASVGYLATKGRARPELVTAFDEATAKAISFGFLFLTIGIIAGAIIVAGYFIVISLIGPVVRRLRRPSNRARSSQSSSAALSPHPAR